MNEKRKFMEILSRASKGKTCHHTGKGHHSFRTAEDGRFAALARMPAEHGGTEYFIIGDMPECSKAAALFLCRELGS